MAQDLDEQPARIAARAGSEPQRVVAGLDARLHPDDVADLALQPGVQADDEIDGVLRAAVDRLQIGEQARPRLVDAAERRQLLVERRRVVERERLGLRFDEEVERIDHVHLGDQPHLDAEAVGLLRHDDAGHPVGLRVLLPVEEVQLRLDGQLIGAHRRAGMRCGAQADDLRSQRHRTVVAVFGAVAEGDANGHGAAAIPAAARVAAQYDLLRPLRRARTSAIRRADGARIAASGAREAAGRAAGREKGWFRADCGRPILGFWPQESRKSAAGGRIRLDGDA